MSANPTNFLVTGIGSSFDTATDLGILSRAGVLLQEEIGIQYFPLDLPGSTDEPGHRDLFFEPHLDLRDRAADQQAGIATVTYNFRDIYGRDPNGVSLHNVITAAQKQRAREVFDLYSYYLGIQFYEVDETQIDDVVTSGVATITIATGDLRALNPLTPTGPNDGINQAIGRVLDPALGLTIPTVILDAAETWDDAYGENWFENAMEGVGSVLGLGRANDLPNITILDNSGSNREMTFPGDQDIVHGKHLFRPESNDIDLYRFDVTADGRMTAEIIAERMTDTSPLDTVLTLYREAEDGSRELIARNDDYFSEDSFLELDLAVGTYFVGVTARGNEKYDPNLEDSGFGGTTQGKYELRMRFRPDAMVGILDATGKLLDGDSDGSAGGVFNTWFQARSNADTIFVDKVAPAGGNNGSLAAPYRTISAALQQAGPGDIVRIVGNGGTDGDLSTFTDNVAYEVGFDSLGQSLADGTSVRVPRDVTVMIDEGAILKLRLSSIIVGSTNPSVNRNHAALQVLGTPANSVYFTSLNDESLALDTNPLTTTPRRGDWGGIEFRNDVDRSEGRGDYEAEGTFLNYVNHAEMRYGGASVLVDSEERVISPLQMVDARPSLTHNLIRFSADAAVAANPNSFEETTFNATDSLNVNYQNTMYTSDYSRVGPNIHDNRLVDNTVNGLFIRVAGSVNGELETMSVAGRWDDVDIVHVVGENLIVAGQAGGGILERNATDIAARRDARLAIDPGVVVKLDGTRIEANFGSQIIAEGTVNAPVVFTALNDNRFGAGGTFRTKPPSTQGPAPGAWAGIYAGPTSSLHIDQAYISYAGGVSSIEGNFAGFNAVEIQQATGRVAHTRFEFNAEGVGGTVASDVDNRNGRGTNADAVVFVRGAQPVLVENLFSNSAVRTDDGGGSIVPAFNINVNALNHFYVSDLGRTTGLAQPFTGSPNNQGPLLRGNRFDNAAMGTDMIHGVVVRGGELTTESVWDDTDIAHVLFGDIIVPDFHTYGGLRLMSAPTESLVVKLGQPTAGVTFNSANFPTTNATEHLVLADFDNDGSLDIATETTSEDIEILLNDGAGNFNASVLYDVGGLSSSIDVGDFDGDGDQDLAVATFTQVAVLSNNGDGTFAMFTAVPLLESNSQDIEVADWDGDGDLDLAVSYFGSGNIEILLNDGNGTFGGGMPFAGAGVGGNEIEAADVDNDGDNDLIVANQFPAQNVSVLLNTGMGAFNAPTQFAVGSTPESVVAGDFNGDGNIDLAVGGANAVYYLEGNGSGNFAAAQTNPIVSTASDIEVGDLNNDGNADVVTSNFLGGTVSVLLGNGNGTFQPSQTLVSNGGMGVALGDVDGNGSQDVATANFNRTVTVLYNTRTASAAGGFFATGKPLENDDRIGGRIQVIGQPGAPVILTSLADDTVGAGLDPEGRSIIDTNSDGAATAPTPGDWNGVILGQYSHDRNVEVLLETESSTAMAPGTNATPLTAQAIGELAPREKAGDENRRLGLEVHGYLSAADRDVYSFRAVGGTEIWIDVDRTNQWLDPVVDLLDANGVILASSSSSWAEANGADTLTGIAEPLRKSSLTPEDLWTTNPRDPGMRLRLPGAAGQVNLYHVRVRMSDDGAPAAGADTRVGGNYQLHLRLRDLDEVAGSTIRFADMRYATNAIQIVGQPGHSPLLGEIAETIADNNFRIDPDPADATIQQAQNLGNILTSDRGAVSLAGTLVGGGDNPDIDWYQFEVNYDDIAGGYPHNVGSFVFDIDYADQLGRPNMSLYVFDADGRLLFFNESSNVADDLTAPQTNSGVSDLSRGTLGRNDAFLGPISLRNGTYFMAVTSSALIPSVLDHTGAAGQGALTVRTEPITTIKRVVEERLPTSTSTLLNPTVNVLFDNESPQPFHLGDITLYVSSAAGAGTRSISSIPSRVT